MHECKSWKIECPECVLNCTWKIIEFIWPKIYENLTNSDSRMYNMYSKLCSSFIFSSVCFVSFQSGTRPSLLGNPMIAKANSLLHDLFIQKQNPPFPQIIPPRQTGSVVYQGYGTGKTLGSIIVTDGGQISLKASSLADYSLLITKIQWFQNFKTPVGDIVLFVVRICSHCRFLI